MARRIGSDGTRTRLAICAAATRLFAAYGYEALTMRRLGEEIGLGAAALYRYFPNKQTILFDLLKSHMDAVLDGWAAANPGPSEPPAGRLAAFVRFHIRFHLGRADMLFLSYMELRSLSPENFAVIESMRRQYEREISAIITAGVDRRTFDVSDARVTSRALLAMLNGLPGWFRAGGSLDSDAIADIYTSMALGLVGSSKTEEDACFMPA